MNKRKQPSKPRAKKWEMVVRHLRAFDASSKGSSVHAEDALRWAKKWPNARSRKETALSATVIAVIHKRIGPGANATYHERNVSACTLADMVAREARLRVVASVQRRANLQDVSHETLKRWIVDALLDVVRELK